MACNNSSSSSNVKVAVRVRPMNRRELDLGAKCIMEIIDNQVIISHPSTGDSHSKQPKTFSYDHCFWSFREADDHYADQETVFNELGGEVMENAFQGFNACILAYGQTGSGKSYTMMGSLNQTGIIPRLCLGLFERIGLEQSSQLAFKVEVSYMEIYNEKVRDLLDPKGSRQNLKVREHAILGPYVDGLSILAVSSHEQIESLIKEGNKARTVAATNMNAESSRSHAVFCIKVTQTLIDHEAGVSGEKVSRVSLVDLAGSERAQKSGAIGDRLREGSSINKSLTTLGLVISALADQSLARGKQKFVPYRDSVLTWLLKDSLGGNSKTVMVATVSPAADNYEESMSTLRYADRAKRIVNHAVVNEDPNAKVIRELKAEVETLRAMLKKQTEAVDLRDRLAESEKLMGEIGKSWEDRLKETEAIHQERQHNLEKMGISVQSSGIKVEHSKFYLVNLNADPSLNELLVYYLKERTTVGYPNQGCDQPDIELHGLGIAQKHAVFSIDDVQLSIEPIDGSRLCINGSSIGVKTLLRHGDRVLFGNNHFFRVNCPASHSLTSSASSMSISQMVLDYDFAQEELMMKEMCNDPVSAAMNALEKQHQLDKEAALEKQRLMYEQQILSLKNQCTSPMTPGSAEPSSIRSPGGTAAGAFPLSNVQARYVQWAKSRDEMFKKSLAKLKEDIVRANSLIREANLMAADMGRQTTFSVTLQIPASNLSPSKIKKSAFISEPAVLVKKKARGSQLWNLEKLENKLIDMRELYQEWTQLNPDDQQILLKEQSIDPFFESQENHSLIGVANVFLEVLFHDVKLDYHVPIISQQGEVAGRLNVEIYRTNCRECPASCNGLDRSLDSVLSYSDSIDLINNNHNLTLPISADYPAACPASDFYGKIITCRVRIKEATGLPPSLSHFVFCQYNLWSRSETVTVPPTFDPNQAVSNTVHKAEGLMFKFNHEKDFDVYVNDEFLEHVQEDALSIQVWGHRTSGFSCILNRLKMSHAPPQPTFNVDDLQGKQHRTLQERWAEVTRRLGLWVEIHELNDHGTYGPVKVVPQNDVQTGGVYVLRQGQQRRIVVSVKATNDYGSLPLVCQEIASVSIGCICVRNRHSQKPLDSYQDLDLELLRQKWGDALTDRKQYLDGQIQRLINKPDKSEVDVEREQALIVQWVALTEERNAVYVPAPNSNVPGAPAEWNPPEGMERHIPVIFLDLKDGIDQNNVVQQSQVPAGAQSILPKERNGKMYHLDLLNFDPEEMTAVAAWDSSLHEHSGLNKVTPNGERVYLIVRVHLRLSHPAEMLLTLHKRCCVQITKAPSFAANWFKRFLSLDYASGSGVFYDIVAHIPKSSLDMEARETLALMAARGDLNDNGVDGESYIEKYTRGISEVESILALDRLRQEVAIRELLGANLRRTMKKTTSLPIAEALKNPNFTLLPRSESTGLDKLQMSHCLKSQSEGRNSLDRSSVLTSLVTPATLLSVPSKGSLTSVKEECPSNSPRFMTSLNSSMVSTQINHSLVQSADAVENVVNGFPFNCGSMSSSGYSSQGFLVKVEDDTVLANQSGCGVRKRVAQQYKSEKPSESSKQSEKILVEDESPLERSTYSDYAANLMEMSIIDCTNVRPTD